MTASQSIFLTQQLRHPQTSSCHRHMAGAISPTASPSPLSSLLTAYPDRATAAGILDGMAWPDWGSISGLTLTLTINSGLTLMLHQTPSNSTN